jgi:hypothetical protein
MGERDFEKEQSKDLLMLGLKSVWLAALVAIASMVAGCGVSEAESNTNDPGLVSKTSAIKTSLHCQGNYACPDNAVLCCQYWDTSAPWGCTYDPKLIPTEGCDAPGKVVLETYCMTPQTLACEYLH